MTDSEIMRNYIANDARNIRDVLNSRSGIDYRTRQLIATDCAAHLVDAWDLGDRSVIISAEHNLREAVALNETHRAQLRCKR
jgi:hypothetical protein